jgi:hypothetical protein
LALAILADYLADDERALRLHQEFKWTVIANLAATNGDCRRRISKVGLNDIADPCSTRVEESALRWQPLAAIVHQRE